MCKIRFRHFQLMLLAAVLAAAAMGCGASPQTTLNGARSAVDEAATARRCKGNKYLKAEKMIIDAENALAAGEEEQAVTLATAARRLAAEAETEAVSAGPNCGRRPLTQEAPPPTPIVPLAVSPGEKPPLDLRPVYFDYDQDTLTEEARNELKHASDLLGIYGTVKVQISGHCDERGSTEYNLALGERRARMVAGFLETLGVDTKRIATISYGEEMPASTSDSQKNRRAEFVVQP